MPLFVYKAMDLNKMEQKVMAHKYKCIEEFLADAHNILHNMVLIYGGWCFTVVYWLPSIVSLSHCLYG